jgi:serine phosphatase RsbU (regulator of sigma subunit)
MADAFGVGRLSDVVRQHMGLPLAQLMQGVFTEIERFTVGRAFPDDVCLVGMEIVRTETPA